MRGTFANIRIRNAMVPDVEGGVTIHLPTMQQMSIYDAAMRYQEEGTPLVVLAGKEYGTGSSRDWAAKGTFLLGAAVAGFLVGRVAKSATGGGQSQQQRPQGGVVPVAAERSDVVPESGAPQYTQAPSYTQAPTPAYGTPLPPASGVPHVEP